MRRRDRQGCDYHAYLPDSLVELDVRLSGSTAADVSDAEHEVARLNTTSPALTGLDALARLLLRAESVASSRIEGLEASGRRLARAQAAAAAGIQVGDATAEAVLGNIEAMSLAVREAARKPTITVADLLAIHERLMHHTTTPQFGGIVRTSQNWVGGSEFNPCSAEFVPPPPEHVTDLLDDLCSYVNGDAHSPVVQAAIAHAQFETIHPFGDGNGRAGRALIHIVLRRRGITPRYVPPISLVLATRSRDYIAGLTAYRHLDSPQGQQAYTGPDAWVATFAAAATRAARDAQTFAARIEELQSGWRDQVGRVRADSSVDRLLRALPQVPILTVATAARLLGRSYQAVNTAVNQLTDAGVLQQTTVGRRNRAFEAVGLLDAVTAFERGLASPSGETRSDPPVRPVPYRSSGAVGSLSEGAARLRLR